MKLCCLLLFFLSLATVQNTPLDYSSIQKQLNSISKKLDQFSSQFNRSIDYLAHKIDENTHELMDLINTHASASNHGKCSSLSLKALTSLIIDDVLIDTHASTARPISALLIIDVQNDFIDGSLALKNCPAKQNGEEVVPVINELLNTASFDVVVYSLDWHPTNHISFFDNLHLRAHLLAEDSVPQDQLALYSVATFDLPGLARVQQTLWPRHCVQKSEGAQLHRDLKVLEDQNEDNVSVIQIYKGTKPDIDSYSAFWDNAKLSETTLHQQLQEKNVSQVFVVGLATDWCVYFTALHAIEHNYKTFIIQDACRGVDQKLINERLKDFTDKNGKIIQSSEVKDYLY